MKQGLAKHVLATVKDVSFPYQVFLILVQEERWSVFLRGRDRAPQVLKSVEFSRVCMVPRVNCGESYHDIKGTVPVDGQRNFIAFREPWFT